MEKTLNFRLARKEDLVNIVQMLADDTLGVGRENFDPNLSESYLLAFEKICQDVNQELTIVSMDDQIVGTFQLSFIQYLTHEGSCRCQVEAVRIHSAFRGQGLGKRVFEYIKNRAQEKACNIVQLTTDKKRPEALKFYEFLGYVASHEGMKLKF